jgi:hypothetical protein
VIRAILIAAAALSVAPLQCAHEPDPNMRHEDTAGDALWDLAAKCHEEKDDTAAKRTLQFLVDRYPSNRHAAAARDELAKTADGGTLRYSP